AALAAGLPILCEKPLAASLADAERIVSAVRERGAPFGVAHHLRHQPAVVWLREQLATGMIGEVRTAHLQWSFVVDHDAANAKWKLDPELGGRHALYDAGVHAVDLAVHLFGEPVRSTGLAATVRSARTADTASVLIEFDHGVLVTVTGSHAASHHGNTLEISGSDGAIVAFGGMGERPIEQLDVVTAEGSATQRFEPGSPYRFVVEDFVRQIEGATPRAAVTTLDEATWAMKVLEAVAGE
ncbi:MAG: Gfo/Idh/MocA family oxidoreductase, partial [Actinomycetota bacterium]